MSLISGVNPATDGGPDGYEEVPVSVVDGAVSVNVTGAPGVPQTPEVSGLPKYMVGLDGGAANGLAGIRATVGAIGDVVAASRLSLGGPVVGRCPANSSIEIHATEPFSRVDVVGIKNGAAGGHCVDLTDVNGDPDSLANAQAQMITFVFSAPVRRAVVTLVAENAFQLGEVSVEGDNYA